VRDTEKKFKYGRQLKKLKMGGGGLAVMTVGRFGVTLRRDSFRGTFLLSKNDGDGR
jgi:hypothetical protein